MQGCRYVQVRYCIQMTSYEVSVKLRLNCNNDGFKENLGNHTTSSIFFFDPRKGQRLTSDAVLNNSQKTTIDQRAISYILLPGLAYRIH